MSKLTSEAELSGQFPKGTKVKLIAGGPTMAVKGYIVSFGDEHDPIVICQWFSGKKLETGNFAPETLVKDDGEEKK
jgi:uncharacterized protein YodC (DUF2158 family)